MLVNQFGESNGNGSVGVLLGNGDGTFQPVVNYDSGGSMASSVAVADVNGDHNPDIAVVDSGGLIGVLLGNGDGSFQPVVTYNLGLGASAIAVADVNGDGKPDLIATVTGNPEGGVAVLLGNGDGTFQAAVTYDSGGEGTESIEVWDVNGDGKPDLLLANICGDANACSTGLATEGSVGVLLGKGDGTFQPVVSYSSGGYTSLSLAVGDTNGDGRPDLLVFSGCNIVGIFTPCNNGVVGVLLGNGDGTFQAVVPYNSGDSGGDTGSLAAADVNGDHRVDLLVTNGAPATISLLQGNGDGSFQSATAYESGGSSPLGLAIADLNGDGLPDLVVGRCGVTGCGGNDGRGNEVGVLLHVGTMRTTTTLASAPNPSFFGQPVAFSAAVTSESGTPPGTVILFDNSTALGSASVMNGNASIIISTLAAGTHNITAVYQGSVTFNSSASASLSQIVTHAVAPTSTAVVSSLNPSIQGQAVTFTAAVSSSGGNPPNGELITFFRGAHILGTATLNSGAASLTTYSRQAGIFTISAIYGGDSNFAASTSTALKQFVDTEKQSTTTTTLSTSLNPSTYQQKITWTSTVMTTGATPPTGKVHFTSNGNSIGLVTLNASGVATLTRSNLNAGSHPLAATYLGDANNGPSESAILNQVVAQATSSATITSSPNPSTAGEAVTFTAKIKSPTVEPTGPVTFLSGKTVLGTAQLSGGKAKFTTSTLAVGSATVTASYSGDSNIGKSSASVTQAVQP